MEWGAGVFVVPVRVLGEGGGLCSELAGVLRSGGVLGRGSEEQAKE